MGTGINPVRLIETSFESCGEMWVAVWHGPLCLSSQLSRELGETAGPTGIRVPADCGLRVCC